MKSKIIESEKAPFADYHPSNEELVLFTRDGEIGIYFADEDDVLIIYNGDDGYNIGSRHTMTSLREYGELFVKFEQQLVLSN